MKLTNEFKPLREWGANKGIFDKGTTLAQLAKLSEEIGELNKAVLNNDYEEIKDAIGDCTVVLTMIAETSARQFKTGLTIEECINSAYEIISKRKGQMINGTFVKEEK